MSRNSPLVAGLPRSALVYDYDPSRRAERWIDKPGHQKIAEQYDPLALDELDRLEDSIWDQLAELDATLRYLRAYRTYRRGSGAQTRDREYRAAKLAEWTRRCEESKREAEREGHGSRTPRPSTRLDPSEKAARAEARAEARQAARDAALLERAIQASLGGLAKPDATEQLLSSSWAMVWAELDGWPAQLRRELIGKEPTPARAKAVLKAIYRAQDAGKVTMTVLREALR